MYTYTVCMMYVCVKTFNEIRTIEAQNQIDRSTPDLNEKIGTNIMGGLFLFLLITDFVWIRFARPIDEIRSCKLDELEMNRTKNNQK